MYTDFIWNDDASIRWLGHRGVYTEWAVASVFETESAGAAPQSGPIIRTVLGHPGHAAVAAIAETPSHPSELYLLAEGADPVRVGDPDPRPPAWPDVPAVGDLGPGTAELGTGWVAGIQTAAQVAPVVQRIQERARELGREIDPEHFGAGVSFRFGSLDEPVVQRTLKGFQRFNPDLDPLCFFAAGDASTVLERIEEYRRAGIFKFVLRPMASGADDAMEQTRRLLAEVLPRVHGGS